MVVEIGADLRFVVADRFDIDQGAREFEDVQCLSLESQMERSGRETTRDCAGVFASR
jgi:hypothetical protein